MAEKLTPIQENILERLKKGIVCHFMPYMGRFGNAYYYMTDNNQSCTAQIHALERKGYIEIEADNFNKRTIKIKEDFVKNTKSKEVKE